MCEAGLAGGTGGTAEPLGPPFLLRPSLHLAGWVWSLSAAGIDRYFAAVVVFRLCR